MKAVPFCHAESCVARHTPLLLLTAALFLVLIEPALAGTTGEEFKDIHSTVSGWVSGYLGRSIALMAFVVGLFYGALKQNFIVALGGVGIAIMIAVIPSVMDKLVSAVI